METLDQHYWENRHQLGSTPWHLNQVSPPLKSYFDQLKDTSLRILIPGAGHAHETLYLVENGFDNITVCDISLTAIQKMQNQLSQYNNIEFINDDFFCLQGTYDLIIEQTFFCALDPKFRKKYVKKMSELLSKSGTLVGVLFASHFTHPGPPFGGDINEYKSLFDIELHIHRMEICINSHPSRQNNEIFFICKKAYSY